MLSLVTLCVLMQLFMACLWQNGILVISICIDVDFIVVLFLLMLFFFFFQLLVDFECLVYDPVSDVSYCQRHPKCEVDCKELVAFNLYILDIILPNLCDLNAQRPWLNEWFKCLGHLVIICSIEPARDLRVRDWLMVIAHSVVDVERYSQNVLAHWLITQADVIFLAVLQLVDHELYQWGRPSWL